MEVWLTVGIALLVGLSAASVGFAVAVLKASREPHADAERRLVARLQDERDADRRFFTQALEEAADIGETIKRHRHRIDGAARGKPAQEAAPATPATPDAQRAEILRRARAMGR